MDGFLRGWMDTLHITLSRVSKWFQSGFKHLFGSLVNLWIWEMTRTLRHLSRAGTSSFPTFFEGCPLFCLSFRLQFLFLAFSFPFLFLSFLSFSFLLALLSFPFLSPSFSLLLPFLSFPVPFRSISFLFSFPLSFPSFSFPLRYNLATSNVPNRGFCT